MPDARRTEITALVAEILDIEPEELAPESRFVEDLMADSMNALELMAILEKRYRIVIGPADMTRVVSLESVWALVEEKLRDRG